MHARERFEPETRLRAGVVDVFGAGVVSRCRNRSYWVLPANWESRLFRGCCPRRQLPRADADADADRQARTATDSAALTNRVAFAQRPPEDSAAVIFVVIWAEETKGSRGRQLSLFKCSAARGELLSLNCILESAKRKLAQRH